MGSPQPALCITLELVRAQHAGDPFAFQATAQRYLLRENDGGFRSTELPWGVDFLTDLEAIRQPDRDPVIAQRVGETLRRFMESAGWNQHEPALLEAIQAGRPVILTLRLAAAELFALPWELLVLRANGQHIGEPPNLLVRYEWPETQARAEEPSPRPEQGRVLLAWSASAGPVPATEYIDSIAQAAQSAGYPFDPDHDVLPQTSLARVTDALADAQRSGRFVSVLNILCHGGEQAGSFGLCLDGNQPGDDRVVVDAAQLRQCLAPFASMVRLVVLSACDSGNSGAIANQLGSVAQNLHRAGFASVLASRYPLSVAGAITLSRTLYHALIADSRSTEAAVMAARSALATDANRLDWVSLQLFAHESDQADTRPLVMRPYRGLLPFQQEQRGFFAGRENDIEEVIADLRTLSVRGRPRFLIVAGASGTGKSSLVMAGVIPQLQSSQPAPQILRMRPGSAPLQALDQQLSLRSQDRPCFLVVDQLEEIFTHCESPSERSEFAKRLWQSAAATGAPFSIIATLRVDFIGRCGELQLDDNGLCMDRVVYDEVHRVFLSQMTRDSLERVISEPALRCGISLETGLANRMLHDLGEEPGGLPILQYTLDLLWQRRVNNTLTQAAYDAIGGVSGALTGRADILIRSLSPAEQRTARHLLVRLVALGSDVQSGTRRRVKLSRVRPQNPDDAKRFDGVLAQLVQQRLISTDGSDDAQTVEVAHEALIRKWTMLATWVHEDRQRITEFEKLDAWVRQWKEQGTLLVAAQLAYAKDLVQRYPDDASDEIRLLVRRSQQRTRRRQWFRAGTVALLVAGSILSATTAYFAWQQSKKARTQAQRSRDLLRLRAAEEQKGDTSLVAALLREVEATQPERLPNWPSAANAALSQAGRMIREYSSEYLSFDSLALHPGRDEFLHTSVSGSIHVWPIDSKYLYFSLHEAEPLTFAIYSPDGNYIAAVGRSGTVNLWRHPGPAPKRQTEVNPPHQALVDLHEPARSLTFSRDGSKLAVLYESGRLRIWSLIPNPQPDDNAPLFRAHRYDLPDLPQNVRAAAWFPDGGQLLVVPQQGPAGLWTLDSPARPTLLHAPGVATDPTVQAAAIDPSGRRIALAYGDQRVRVFDPTQPQAPQQTFDPHGGTIKQLAFSPDGQRLLASSTDHAIYLWRMSQTSPLHTFRLGSAIHAVQFSADGSAVLSASDDNQARIWMQAGGYWQQVDLRGHRNIVRDALFLSDGRRVLTISEDYTARLWTFQDDLATTIAWQTPRPPQHITLSRDGEYAAATQGDEVLLWTHATARAVPLRGHRDAVVYSAFSLDSKQLVTIGNDSRALIWQTADAKQVHELAIPPGTHRAALSRDHRLLATAADRNVLVTRIQAPSRTWTFADPAGRIQFLQFNPAGTWLIAASTDRTLRVWDLTGTGGPGTYHGHVDAVTMAAFGLDNSDLVSVSADRRLIEHRSYPKFTQVVSDRIQHVAFDTGSKRVIAAAHDGTAHIFTRDGSVGPIVLAGPKEPLSAAVFAASGQHILTASARGIVRRWTVSDDGASLRHALWTRYPYCLSVEQREQLLHEPSRHANAEVSWCMQFTHCLGVQHENWWPLPARPFGECLERYRRDRNATEIDD